MFLLPCVAPALLLSAASHVLTQPGEEGNAGGYSRTQSREVNGNCVPVSRVILVAKSKFFRKMLTGGFREASSCSKVDIFLEADGKGRIESWRGEIWMGPASEHVMFPRGRWGRKSCFGPDLRQSMLSWTSLCGIGAKQLFFSPCRLT